MSAWAATLNGKEQLSKLPLLAPPDDTKETVLQETAGTALS